MKHLLACLATLLGTLAFIPAQEKTAFTVPRHLPGGGVADPAGKLAFFPNTRSGIDALDLASGKVLWASSDASHVLVGTDNRLYAWKQASNRGNQFRVVVLDTTADGKRVLESELIALTEWIHVGVEHGRSYASVGRLNDKGLWIRWEAKTWYAGGAEPTPEREKAERREAAGIVHIDTKTGKVKLLPADAVSERDLPKPGKERTSVKIGDVTYSIKDVPAGNPANELQKRRSISAVGAAGETLWSREIRAPVTLPLRK